VIVLTLVVVAATAVGLEAQRRMGDRAERASALLLRGMLWVVLPIVAFFNVAALDFRPEVVAGIAYGWASVATGGFAAYLIGSRVLHLPRPALGALILVGGLGNTGFLGLPFQVVLFGRDVLTDAVAYDVLVSGTTLVILGFLVGAAFGTVADRKRDRLRVFVTRNPPLWAVVAGLIAPEALAPQVAVDVSQLLVLAVVPFGFFAVGVTLAASGTRGLPPLDGAVITALACKLVAAPALVLSLSAVFMEVPDVYLVQPAMACALNSLVVANEYGLDRRICAAAVAWSTVLVLAVGLVVSLL